MAMNNSHIANTTAFNVWNQNFTLLDPNGEKFTVGTSDIDQLQDLAVTTALVFASQLGASLILLVVLLLMTSPNKRCSLSFVFSALALLCDVIRCTLQCVLLKGPLMNFMVLSLFDFRGPEVERAIAISITVSVFTFILFVLIMAALITQVRVVCLTASRLQRTTVTISTSLIALVAIGFRINLMAINIRNTVHVANTTREMGDQQTWAQSACNISSIVAICVFSFVFCFKLAMAIRSRRALGLKQFGAMQIIFIMGCQTLTIPLVFAILAYYALPGSQIRSFVETLVAIFLPLSSMWAVASTNAKLPSAVVAFASLPRASPGAHSAPPAYNSGKDLLPSITTDTIIDSPIDTIEGKKDEEACMQGVSPGLNKRKDRYSDLEHNVEMRTPRDSIHVDQSYTVNSDRISLDRPH